MSKHITKARKESHIKIVSTRSEVEPSNSSFDGMRLPVTPLPEISKSEVQTRTSLFGYEIAMPFFISSMSGGSQYGKILNTNLAKAAQAQKIGLALGSMRILIEDPSTFETFNVRHLCPDIPLFANVGLVQFNHGYDEKHLIQLIDMIKADGVCMHINALQEAIQPEGDTDFSNLLSKLDKISTKTKSKIIIKEVGNGIPPSLVKKLYDIGIQYVDVSGMGGTSWTVVEGLRRPDDVHKAFIGEGFTTREILEQIPAQIMEKISIIAGGGIRNGVHIAKALFLGAKYTTSAKPFLETALNSAEETEKLIATYKEQLTIAMFVCGIKQISDFKKINPLLKV